MGYDGLEGVFFKKMGFNIKRGGKNALPIKNRNELEMGMSKNWRFYPKGGFEFLNHGIFGGTSI